MTDRAAIADVDALVAAGDLAAAADRLEARLNEDPALAAQGLIWLQYAGLRRMLRQPHRALSAVDRALALDPRDFMALTMRAGLVERISPADAGQAWHRALLQRPDGPLPPQLEQALAGGQALHDAWMATRERTLRAAIAPMESAVDADTAWRMRRFCDNTLGKTRRYRSEPIHFSYPGLTEREFHPRARFPWLERLEAAAPEIRREMEALLASQRADLVPYLQYDAHETLDQWRALNHNLDWTAVHLLNCGTRVEANASACPVTMDVLGSIGQPRIDGASPNAMFSLLAPHTAIPPHVGISNARLVCHLALAVPPGCWFRVGAETRAWREGEAWVFDDTIEHEALNPSAVMRAVLIFDVWHPDLTVPEQQAYRAAVESENSSGTL